MTNMNMILKGGVGQVVPQGQMSSNLLKRKQRPVESEYEKIKVRRQLLKRWITLSTGQISIQGIKLQFVQILICWIVSYPVERTVQLLNDQGQDFLDKIRQKACLAHSNLHVQLPLKFQLPISDQSSETPKFSQFRFVVHGPVVRRPIST